MLSAWRTAKAEFDSWSKVGPLGRRAPSVASSSAPEAPRPHLLARASLVRGAEMGWPSGAS
eukprot:6765606-Lingulodinium_polyedra.AAC.1